MDETPTNKFREGLKERAVSEQEMLERDQKATYLELKNQAEMRESDKLHLQAGITKLKAFGNQVFQLPDSEGRVAILEQNKKHIEQLEKQLEVSVMNRAQQVILSVLEEKFGLQCGADEKAIRPDITNSPPSGVDGSATQSADSEPKELKDD